MKTKSWNLVRPLKRQADEDVDVEKRIRLFVLNRKNYQRNNLCGDDRSLREAKLVLNQNDFDVCLLVHVCFSIFVWVWSVFFSSLVFISLSVPV